MAAPTPTDEGDQTRIVHKDEEFDGFYKEVIQSSPLAKGAQGEVFRGVFSGQVVAVKVFPEEYRQEFRDELILLNLVSAHENVISLVRVHVPGPALVYEFAEHGSAWDILIEYHTSLKPVDRLLMCLHATQGLAHVHSCGVAHLDIKPENLLVATPSVPTRNPLTTPAGAVVKLTDFGIASAVRMSPGPLGAYTERYAAPEVLANEGNIDCYAYDSFSLGYTMYAFLESDKPTRLEGNSMRPLPRKWKKTMIGAVASLCDDMASKRMTPAEAVTEVSAAVAEMQKGGDGFFRKYRSSVMGFPKEATDRKEEKSQEEKAPESPVVPIADFTPKKPPKQSKDGRKRRKKGAQLSYEENKAKLRDINAKVAGLDKSFYTCVDLPSSAARWFLYEGVLWKSSGKKKTEERYFFLFSDMIIWTDRKGPTDFKQKKMAWLSEVGSLEDHDGNTFSFSAKKKIYSLTAADEREKSAWLSAISGALRSLQSPEAAPPPTTMPPTNQAVRAAATHACPPPATVGTPTTSHVTPSAGHHAASPGSVSAFPAVHAQLYCRMCGSSRNETEAFCITCGVAAPRSSGSGDGVPAGWQRGTDPSSGRTFWVNLTTGISQWTTPPGAPVSPVPVATPSIATASYSAQTTPANTPSGWAQQVDGSGRQYWVNLSTGVSQWHAPQAPPASAPASVPAAPALAPAPTPAPHAAILPAGWIQQTDNTGRTFYVFTPTGASQWTLPTGPPPTPARYG